MMTTRQTFYLTPDVSEALRRHAFEAREKISTVVNNALKKIFFPEKKKKTHSAIQHGHLLRSLKNIDPVASQKKLREEW